MPEEKKNEIHEPTLSDSDDYSKPMSKSKLKTILIFFGVLIAAYLLFVLVLS